MKTILHHGDKYVLRFDRGEEVIEALAEFCRTEGIEAASFSAIGSCSEAIISYYDIPVKKYIDLHLKENLEIISLSGNVSKLNYKPLVHAHGSFSDLRMQMKGGHVKKLTVSATCEVILQKLKGWIEREFDEETGLNLMHS